MVNHHHAEGLKTYSSKGILGKPHKKAVSCLKFSGDEGRLLASASADTTIRIYDVAKREQVRELLGHNHGVSDVAWARDSQYLASGSDDKSIKIWDTETGQEITKLMGHTSYVFCLSFNTQGSLIASGSCDEIVKVWDLRSGLCLRTLPAHAEPVTAVDFNRDGTCIVSSSYDGLIRIWDTSMGECLKTIFADGNPPVSHVRYTPNSRYILTSSLDSTIRLWNVASPSKCVKTYRGHKNHRFCIFSAFALHGGDGAKRVISGSEDGHIYVWDLQSRVILQKLEAHEDAVISVASHPTQSILASGGMNDDCTVRLWELGDAAAVGPSAGLAPSIAAAVGGGVEEEDDMMDEFMDMSA